MLSDLLGFTSTMLNNVLAVVAQVLPDSPFQAISKIPEVTAVLGFVNWVVPLSEMMAIFQAWITAIVVFYVYQIVLRWARAIE
jgi:flagellar biosynthesis protein FliQ